MWSARPTRTRRPPSSIRTCGAGCLGSVSRRSTGICGCWPPRVCWPSAPTPAGCASMATPALTTTSPVSPAAGSTTYRHATTGAGGAASRRAPGSRSWITGRSTTAAAARVGGSAVAHLSPDKGGHMAGLKGTKSFENLKEAFAGESQANRRYLYFARVADIEGFPDIAGLFKDTADAETGHAFGHLDFLKEVGDPATGEPIGKTEKNRQDREESQGGGRRRDLRVHADVPGHGQDGAQRRLRRARGVVRDAGQG